MTYVVPYEPKYRQALLDLSIRAWEPVFPRMAEDVPTFVYQSFYPAGWRKRQRDDLAEVLDGEPGHVDVALHNGSPVGWVCTLLHPEDHMGEIHFLVVDPRFQRHGIGNDLKEHACRRVRAAGMRMMMVETGDDRGQAPARAAYISAGFERWPRRPVLQGPR